MKKSLVILLLQLISRASFGDTTVPPDLIGSWTTYYYKTSFASVKSEIIITDGTLQQNIEFTGALAIGAPDGQIIRNSFLISSVEPSTENPDTFIANIKVEKIEVAANGAWEAERLSKLSYCDISDWQPGRFYDVTGLRCKETGSSSESWHNHPDKGERSKIWLNYSDSKLYIKNPIEPMNSNIPESKIDFNHPLFKKLP